MLSFWYANSEDPEEVAPLQTTSLCTQTSLILLFLSVCAWSTALSQDLIRDSNEDDDFSDYVVADLYQHYNDDSLILGQTVGVTSGWYLGKSRFIYEWQRPMISIALLRSRENKARVLSTVLVMSASMAVSAWTMALMGKSEDEITETTKYILGIWGPHLGFRPSRTFTLYAGVIPDLILFSKKDDGLLLQWRAGFRIDVKKALVLNAGYAKTRFVGFESPDCLYPGGVYVGLSYSPPNGKLEYNRPGE